MELRSFLYTIGSDREIFLTDVLCAVFRKRVANSVWTLIPPYSDAALELWIPVFRNGRFPHELWPSQKELALNGVLAGKSAVVQMPTSAGKTKAIEMIVRSAFLAGRCKLAVIVTPFRALCHEVRAALEEAFRNDDIAVNEFTDVLLDDVTSDLSRPTVIAVTPEKLLYVIRNNAAFAGLIGQVIYDEAHQFDSGRRGVTYPSYFKGEVGLTNA